MGGRGGEGGFEGQSTVGTGTEGREADGESVTDGKLFVRYGTVVGCGEESRGFCWGERGWDGNRKRHQ